MSKTFINGVVFGFLAVLMTCTLLLAESTATTMDKELTHYRLEVR